MYWMIRGCLNGSTSPFALTHTKKKGKREEDSNKGRACVNLSISVRWGGVEKRQRRE